MGTPFTVTSLRLALFSPATAAAVGAQTESRRLNVSAEKSIAAEVQNAHAQVISDPKFTLHAEVAGTETDFEVNVREAVPAVTSETTTSVGNGKSRYVEGRDVATILVSDQPDALAFITVEENGRVNGIVQKDGDKVKFTQSGRGQKVSLDLGTESLICVSLHYFLCDRC